MNTVNRLQKIVIIIGILLLIISFLFPPWGDYFPIQNQQVVMFIGHSFLFHRPSHYLHEHHEEIRYVKPLESVTFQTNGKIDSLEIDISIFNTFLSGNDSELIVARDSIRVLDTSRRASKKVVYPNIAHSLFEPADFPSKQERLLSQLIQIDSFIDEIPKEQDSLRLTSDLRIALAILQIEGESLLTESQRECLINVSKVLPQLQQIFPIPLQRIVQKVNNPLIGFAGIYHQLLLIQIALIVLVSIGLILVLRGK